MQVFMSCDCACVFSDRSYHFDVKNPLVYWPKLLANRPIRLTCSSLESFASITKGIVGNALDRAQSIANRLFVTFVTNGDMFSERSKYLADYPPNVVIVTTINSVWSGKLLPFISLFPEPRLSD